MYMYACSDLQEEESLCQDIERHGDGCTDE